MRRGIGLLGGLLLAVLCWAEPVAAQGLPQGSYLQSCTRVSLQGDNLIAVCRRADGGEQRTSLAGVHHLKLPVTDLARSREWYHSRLGYELRAEMVEWLESLAATGPELA